MTVNDLQAEIAEISQDHGWRDTELNIPEELLLLHCEVSEALQEYRTGNAPGVVRWEKPNEPTGFPVEIVDVIIRCIDLLDRLDIPVGYLIQCKNEYNKTREYRHGGKLL